MAVLTITDLRTIIDEGDSNAAWTSTGSLGNATAEPTPIEATDRLEIVVSNTTQDSYVTITSLDMTGMIIYFWFSHRAELDLLANVGVGIQIGDGTNRISYGIIGSDAVAFSHFEGPVVWQCLVLDVSNKAAYPQEAITGSDAALDITAITSIGLKYTTLVKSVGGGVNCFIDIGRYLNIAVNDGCAIRIGDGATGGTEGTHSQTQNLYSRYSGAE